MMPICGVNIHTSLNSQPPKLIFPQLFDTQSIVMHVRINPNVSRIIINSFQSSLPTSTYNLHLHSNWKIVNWHLSKCADERDI